MGVSEDVRKRCTGWEEREKKEIGVAEVGGGGQWRGLS